MGLLVGAMDIATANNTVAIVMANPIAKEMSEDYGISPTRTACLLDTFSCIFQGIIPYGAQMLVAISAAAEMGFALSAFSIMRYLFYPYLLLVSSLVAIFLVLGMVFAIFAPMNHNFEHMTPDYFDEYYPDTNDGTTIPADKGSILPAYELSESFAVVSVDF